MYSMVQYESYRVGTRLRLVIKITFMALHFPVPDTAPTSICSHGSHYNIEHVKFHASYMYMYVSTSLNIVSDS